MVPKASRRFTPHISALSLKGHRLAGEPRRSSPRARRPSIPEALPSLSECPTRGHPSDYLVTGHWTLVTGHWSLTGWRMEGGYPGGPLDHGNYLPPVRPGASGRKTPYARFTLGSALGPTTPSQVVHHQIRRQPAGLMPRAVSWSEIRGRGGLANRRRGGA